MKCPQCAHLDTSVIDSRIIEDGFVIRRRRECESCKYRFSTLEKRIITELLVIKKDGTKELYERAKVKKALILSFAKRNVQAQLIDEIVNQLELQRSKT
jgi:transcriptional repressor NrdR